MNKSQKVRAVFETLRPSLDGEFPSHEILSTAAKIVELFDENNFDTSYRLVSARRTFEELDIDEAISDGGWRVMRREAGRMNQIYGVESDERFIKVELKSYGLDLAA